MTHFATTYGAVSPAEAELAVIGSGSTRLDNLAPLGAALLIARDRSLTIVVIAVATGFDADGWWTQ